MDRILIYLCVCVPAGVAVSVMQQYMSLYHYCIGATFNILTSHALIF